MKKLTTILCSIAFAISGICLANAVIKSNATYGTQIVAATMPPVNLSTTQLPVDLQLNKLAQSNKVDTVRDTVYVPQAKSIEVNVPCRVKTKTVHVPVLYIATRTDVKEDTVDHKPTYMYKVYKVGEYDLKKLESSMDVNQHYIFYLQLCAVGRYISQVSTHSRSH